MPIKKSTLEKKFFYRVAKVFFLLLPFLAAIVLFLEGYVDIEGITEKNVLSVLQKNSVYVAYAVGGVILYYLILNILWKGLLYIAFGGLEDDMKKEIPAPLPATISPQQANTQDGATVAIIFLIILVIVFAVVYSSGNSNGNQNKYGSSSSSGKTTTSSSSSGKTSSSSGKTTSSSSSSSSGNKGSTCIPTGCGTNWHCTGSYYLNGVEVRVDACFPTGMRPSEIHPGWSGKCRQCP